MPGIHVVSCNRTLSIYHGTCTCMVVNNVHAPVSGFADLAGFRACGVWYSVPRAGGEALRVLAAQLHHTQRRNTRARRLQVCVRDAVRNAGAEMPEGGTPDSRFFAKEHSGWQAGGWREAQGASAALYRTSRQGSEAIAPLHLCTRPTASLHCAGALSTSFIQFGACTVPRQAHLQAAFGPPLLISVPEPFCNAGQRGTCCRQRTPTPLTLPMQTVRPTCRQPCPRPSTISLYQPCSASATQPPCNLPRPCPRPCSLPLACITHRTAENRLLRNDRGAHFGSAPQRLDVSREALGKPGPQYDLPSMLSSQATGFGSVSAQQPRHTVWPSPRVCGHSALVLNAAACMVVFRLCRPAASWRSACSHLFGCTVVLNPPFSFLPSRSPPPRWRGPARGPARPCATRARCPRSASPWITWTRRVGAVRLCAIPA